MEKGDKVHYIPHKDHALQRDSSGCYPWAIGRKEYIPKVVAGRATMEERVVELKGVELENFLDAVRRHPNAEAEMGKVVLIRPTRHWEATVRAVNEDGTVNLDIEVGNGVTLHYNNIDMGEGPHTCREI